MRVNRRRVRLTAFALAPMVRARRAEGASSMAVSKEQVLAALAKVAAPDGTAADRDAGVLSDIVVTDGKVFFSITVDAAVGEGLGAGAQARGRRGQGRAGRAVRAGRAHRRTQPAGSARGSRSPRSRRRAPHAHAQPRAAGRQARSRAFPASTRSSRSRPAKAASANRRPRSISRSACATSASRSACSMPTSTARRCRSCWRSRRSRRRSAAPG